MEDFYLTINSDSSVYSTNSHDHFTTLLSKPVRLTGRWEIGLAQIHLSNDYKILLDNLDLKMKVEEKTRIKIEPVTEKNIRLTSSHFMEEQKIYNENHELVLTMKIDERELLSLWVLKEGVTVVSPAYDIPTRLSVRELAHVVTIKPEKQMTQVYAFTIKIKEPVKFKTIITTNEYDFNIDTLDHDLATKLPQDCYIANKHLTVGPDSTLHLSDSLKQALNLINNHLTPGVYPIDFVDLADFNTFYVLSDLVESQFVGEKFLPLLRTVSGSKIYNKVYYIPLSRNVFQSFEVHIITDTNQIPLFKTQTRLVLHVRKC